MFVKPQLCCNWTLSKRAFHFWLDQVAKSYPVRYFIIGRGTAQKMEAEIMILLLVNCKKCHKSLLKGWNRWKIWIIQPGTDISCTWLPNPRNMFRVRFNLHVSVWFQLLNSFNEIGLKSSFALNRITHKLHLTFCFKLTFLWLSWKCDQARAFTSSICGRLTFFKASTHNIICSNQIANHPPPFYTFKT